MQYTSGCAPHKAAITLRRTGWIYTCNFSGLNCLYALPGMRIERSPDTGEPMQSCVKFDDRRRIDFKYIYFTGIIRINESRMRSRLPVQETS